MAPPLRKTWLVLISSVFAQAAISGLQLGLPALGPAIHVEAGFDTATIGLLFGLAGVAAAIAVIAWGRIADRTSDRFVSVVGLLLTAGALVLAGVAAIENQFIWMGALLVISGISAAAPSIGIIKNMSGSFTGHPRLGLAFGTRQAAVPIGAGIAGLVLPIIALQAGIAAALTALAVALIVAGIAMAVALRHPGRQSPPAPITGTGTTQGEQPAIPWPLLAPILIAAILLTASQVGITALLSLYLFTARGWSYGGAAAAFTFVMLTAGAARVLMGMAADRWPRARVLLICLIGLLTAVLLIIVAVTGEYQISAVLLIIAAISGMGWASLPVTVIVAAVPTARIGQVQGIYNAMCWFGAGFAPIIIGLVVQEYGWPLGWILLAISSIAGVIVASTRVRSVLVAPEAAMEQTSGQ
ncbi:MAG: MFS transporter [Candidatus Nanopelagicales bacterium]|nr:MFS transporter [Candidatus Nanopelagicales bacterium]